MPFERPNPEEQNERIGEASLKLSEIIEGENIDILERAIRFLAVNHRERLYRAIELSKIATDDLMKK